MATGYSRASAGLIISGAVITAANLEAEFAAIANAFGATGHNHTGSSQGGPIDLTVAVTGVLPIANGGTNATTAASARTALGLVIGANVQAWDAGLDSISGLTTAADKTIYTTALDTYAVTTLTSFGRSLIDDVDAATSRTTLGLGTAALSASTDFQPVDTELTALAGLTSAADRLPYFTGSGTAALATFTSAGRSLVDDADAAAMRTTLGLVIGTNVQAYDANYLKSNTTATLVVGYAVTPFSFGTKSSGTFTPAEANGAWQYGTNGGAHTLAPPTNATNLVLEYTNNGSAGAITTSGFTKVDGAFDTTNAHKFICYITKHQTYSYLNIVALQ